MEDEIKISVIIPVYNTEKYLEKCINSIISQSLKEIEIIIINDNSTDNSLNIIKKYIKKDKRIILIDKKRNEGVAVARNLGIEKSRGKYIFCIDSDDWIEEKCLEEMYNKAIFYNADIVIVDFYFDYVEKNKIFYTKDQGSENGILSNEKALKNMLEQGKGFPAIWNKLIKRELYIKNDIKFFDKISAGEDLLITTLLLYYSKKIIKLNQAYLHYIQRENSITKQDNCDRLFDIHFVLNEIEKFLMSKKIKITLNNLKLSHLSYWIFKITPKYNDEKYNEILKNYIFLLEKEKEYSNGMNYIKYYRNFRKIFNSKNSFNITWKITYYKSKIRKVINIIKGE